MRRELLLIAVIAVGGCGGGDNTATTTSAEVAPASPKAERHVRLIATDFKYDPVDVTGEKEGLVSIRLVNKGGVAHALAVDGPNGEIIMDGSVAPGSTGTLEADLDRPGTYDMYCPIDGHRAKGMTGTITVGGSTAARGPERTTSTTSTQTTPTQTQTQTTTTTTQTSTTPNGGTPSDQGSGGGTGGASPGSGY